MDNNNPNNRDNRYDQPNTTEQHNHVEKESTNPLTVVLSVIALIILLLVLAFIFGAFRAADEADIDVQVPTPTIQEQLPETTVQPESEQSAPPQENTQTDDSTTTDQQTETEPTN